jgi:hypothetical protein
MKNKHTCKYWKEKCTVGYECCPNDWDETECDNYIKGKQMKIKSKNVKINTSAGETIVVSHKINHVCAPKKKTIKKK